jgi:hypothetical protein
VDSRDNHYGVVIQTLHVDGILIPHHLDPGLAELSLIGTIMRITGDVILFIAFVVG